MKKLIAPTAKQIKAFTPEEIMALSEWLERDKVTAGSFAKYTKKGKSSLVFIVENDLATDRISICHCNPATGFFGMEGDYCKVKKVEEDGAWKWVHAATDSANFVHLFND